jgi:hypothetical protein
MDAHESRHRVGRQVIRGLLALSAVSLGLALAVSLADAGRNASWGASELQLQNVDFLPRSITTTFYSPPGSIVSVLNDTLLGGRGDVLPLSLSGSFTGTVSVDGPGAVLGVVTHLDLNPPGAAQWPLVDDSNLSNVAYVPYYATQLLHASRIKVHNLEAIAATAVITFYNNSGGVVDTQVVSLPPLGARFLSAADLGVPSTFQASAVIRANRRIYAAVDQSELLAYAGAQAPAYGGTEIVAPMFFANHNFRDSTFAVQNVSAVTTTGVLTFYAHTGVVLETQPFTLAPYAALVWTASSNDTYGHVVATADQTIAGLVLGKRQVIIPSLELGLWDYTAVVVKPDKPDTHDRRTAYGPAVFSNHLSWNSDVYVANLSANAASITIEYSSAPSGTLTTTVRSVQPHGVIVFSDASLLPLNFEHSAIRLMSDQTIASAILSTNLLDATDFMAYEAQYASPIVPRIYLPVILR